MNRSTVLAGLAVFAVAVMGLAVIVTTTWAILDIPSHQVQLSGTRWLIASVAGDAPETPPAELAFEGYGSHAGLFLPCGNVRLEWTMDTDGAGLGFFNPESLPAACSAATSSGRAVLAALLAVDHWSVQNADRITFSGTKDLRLERADPG